MARDGKKRITIAYHMDEDIQKYVNGVHEKLNPNSENGKPSKANIAEIVFNLGIERDRELRG